MPSVKNKPLIDPYGKETPMYYHTDEYLRFCDKLSVKLFKIAKKAGLTQSEVANELHVTRQFVSAIAKRGGLTSAEWNRKRNITKTPAYLILEYAKLTGVSPNEILGWDSVNEERKKASPGIERLNEIAQGLDEQQLQLLISVATNFNRTKK